MLDIRNITKIFGEGGYRVVALNNISLTVDTGNFVAIMGPSGSGKSTFLNIIGGLDCLTSGEVVLDGKRIDNLDENALVDVRRGKISYVFQQYHLISSLTALENVLLPLTFRGEVNRNGKAVEMLRRVGLERRATHKPGQLSGGEQQRVAIARALVSNPSLILADEPTGNMDQTTGREILQLFDQLNKEGHTIIMVTHDPDIARNARETIVLKDGQIIETINNGKEGTNA
jgi:putative ABC transport system ATP-binding protein